MDRALFLGPLSVIPLLSVNTDLENCMELYCLFWTRISSIFFYLDPFGDLLEKWLRSAIGAGG